MGAQGRGARVATSRARYMVAIPTTAPSIQLDDPRFYDTDALINIAKALPSLRTLALWSTSSVDAPPAFPMSILPTLGSLCYQLELLCLYMDTSPPALPPICASTGDSTPFECLDKLDVGTSSLDSPAPEVAAYLSSLLREHCQLSRVYDLCMDNGGPKHDSWQPVIDFLPVMIRVRKAEKEAAVAMASHVHYCSISTIHHLKAAWYQAPCPLILFIASR